jgi:hypothetical protein
MTDSQAAGAQRAVLNHYCESFRTLLGHLASLRDCAESQEAAAQAGDFAALEHATAARREIMQAIARIDDGLLATRALLAPATSTLRTVPRFAEVDQLHACARDLIASIAARDERVQAALTHARDRAGADAHQLEMGGTSLAAYRRVVAPPPDSAELVDRRG